MRIVAAAIIACLLAEPAGAADALRRITINSETLKDVPVVAPAGEPTATVALISGPEGWNDAMKAQADTLAKAGATVIGIDLPTYIPATLKTAEECVFMSGDIEDLARITGKTLGIKTYRLPVVMGAGVAGDVAYAMLSQAPANMFSGAVSIGFTGRLKIDKPLCDGPTSTKREGDDLVLGSDPPKGLQGEWRVLTPAPAQQWLKDFADKLDDATVVEVKPGDNATSEANDAAFDIGGGSPDAVNNLPLVLYPPKEGKTARGLVVVYAGDGGWRDLDQTIAEHFNEMGYAIVGIDTLRYFWNEKTPREMGDDLEAILQRYAPQWGAKRVMLAGYSFGADVIPFAWARISKQSRDEVRLIALLGLSKTADFQLSVSGWLGVGSGEHDVLKASAGLPMDRVACVYGKEELEDTDNDVACATDTFPQAARLELPGGHHFDEDYEALAKRLDAEFVKRAGTSAAATPAPAPAGTPPAQK